MINFLKVFAITFIKILLFMIAFCYSVYLNSDGAYIIPDILLIVYLIFHFIYLNKLCYKLNLRINQYNIYGFISWISISCIITYLVVFSNGWISRILPKRSGGYFGFDGLEYLGVPLLLGTYLIVICILKLIIFIVKKIK